MEEVSESTHPSSRPGVLKKMIQLLLLRITVYITSFYITCLVNRFSPSVDIPCCFASTLASFKITKEEVISRRKKRKERTPNYCLLLSYAYCHIWWIWFSLPSWANQAPTGWQNCLLHSSPLRLLSGRTLAYSLHTYLNMRCLPVGFPL